MAMSTEIQVLNFLTSWKNGILNISKSYIDKNEYKEKALDFIKNHYLFEVENVLFKPTLTKTILFRNDLNSALSYFIGGPIAEDTGFAIRPWKDINIDEVNNLLENDLIITMGVFTFTLFDTNELTKVAFTFVLKHTDNKLKIKVHHSSIIPT
tara:strand:- start:69 stop:527 length:459 start_codon:yes stop_codon:yes gene_type:complete